MNDVLSARILYILERLRHLREQARAKHKHMLSELMVTSDLEQMKCTLLAMEEIHSTMDKVNESEERFYAGLRERIHCDRSSQSSMQQNEHMADNDSHNEQCSEESDESDAESHRVLIHDNHNHNRNRNNQHHAYGHHDGSESEEDKSPTHLHSNRNVDRNMQSRLPSRSRTDLHQVNVDEYDNIDVDGTLIETVSHVDDDDDDDDDEGAYMPHDDDELNHDEGDEDDDDDDDDIDLTENIYNAHEQRSAKSVSSVRTTANTANTKRSRKTAAATVSPAKSKSRKKAKRTYVCDDCGYATPRRWLFDNHRRTHTGHKPFVCDVCDKAFAQRNALLRHSRVHTGERPYQCPHCEKTFSYKNCLDLHLRVHSGHKPYKCTQCEHRASDPSNLRRHEQTHTRLTRVATPARRKAQRGGERSFQCEHCNQMFTRNTRLQKHLKSCAKKEDDDESTCF